MPPKDVDAIAIWDAKARTLIGRIDAVLGDVTHVAPDDSLDGLVHRVITRTPPPAGEILRPARTDDSPSEMGQSNMGHQSDRIDHWDAYVCRFGDEDAQD